MLRNIFALIFSLVAVFNLAACDGVATEASAGVDAAMHTAQSTVEGPKYIATSLHGTVTYQDILHSVRSDSSVVPAQPDVPAELAVYNREAVIPPMCYTKTEGRHNPCYVCHQDQIPGRENAMNDAPLQAAYSFSDVGTHNHWKNLFEDRSAAVAQISDADIQAWVSSDNYSALAPRLRAANFRGWIPDLNDLQLAAEAFDEEGFAKDGSQWVAFNYKPFPSTFWPTNGSIGDVMIRLPEVFRIDEAQRYSRAIYQANLAIVEARIKGLDAITVNAIDERDVARDLNEDGILSVISEITQVDDYVGAAQGYYSPPSVYPLNTEFLHTVRYVGVDSAGGIYLPPRMKEVRYMKKEFILSAQATEEGYRQEHYEKELGNLPGYINRGHKGLDNEMGWVLTSFIENKQGELRFNSYEENLFCMGCHSSIGATIDKTFSFPRKIDGADGWGYVDLRGMKDVPNRGEIKGEIATYFERVGGGGEFRSNPEMKARWFDSNDRPDAEKLAKAQDVYDLIMPSPERAWQLNKAYKAIVHEQDFIYGRDAFVSAPENVYQDIDNATAPTLPADKNYRWDIRLDWSQQSAEAP